MDQFDKNPKAILDNIKQLLSNGAKDRNHAFLGSPKRFPADEPNASLRVCVSGGR